MEVSARQRAFVLEYLVDHKQTDAAIRAGYSAKTAHVTACKLMKKVPVRRLIDQLEKKSREDFQIQRYEVLYHLHAMATRDGRDLVSDDGKLLEPEELKALPDGIGLAIDVIKQKVLRHTTNDDGTEETILETEVKLVSKAAAVDMAMRHKGLFEADKSEVKVVMDFDQMIQDQRHTIDAGPIEERLRLEEQ